MHAAVRRILITGLLLCFAAVPAGCGSSSSSGSFSGASPTVGSLQAGAYPTPQDETFQGCPPQGDGGDSALNIKKNRIDSGTWQSDTVSNLVSLPYPQGVVKQPRASWSAADAATVAQSEGRPLQVEGYLLLVRHEGTESPNCHDSNERDFHMWLAGSPGGIGDRASSMIVEVTPRSRALNPNWQPDSRLLGLTGHHVRISGWLLLDQEHPEQVGKTRGTLWEIHPVMKIEVEQGGTWTDLNDTSLQISGGSVNSGSNSGGSGTSSSRHRHRRSHSRNGA
jgi:hypothetical protein